MHFISQINQLCQKNYHMILEYKDSLAHVSEIEFQHFTTHAHVLLYEAMYGVAPSVDVELVWQEIKSSFLKEKELVNQYSFTYNDLVEMFFFHQESFQFFSQNGFDFSKPSKEGFNLYDNLKKDAIETCKNNFSHYQESRTMDNGFIASFIEAEAKNIQKNFFLYPYIKSCFNNIFSHYPKKELMDLGLQFALEYDKPMHIQEYLEHGAHLGQKIYDIEFQCDISSKTKEIYSSLIERQKVEDEKSILEKHIHTQMQNQHKIKI